ncbi:MAG: hypothetical protein ACXVJD_07775 [Mucilaginibacter sp.]
MESQNSHALIWKPAQSWLAFTMFTVLILWFAHALAFFPHEYAHSFSAWLLGWKSNPLALNYGQITTSNLLVQLGIDENVDYAPIFAGGHGQQAGLIALAGLFVGNFLITYPLSYWGCKLAKQHDSRTLGLFFYWLYVASVGNLIDYVPVRTFATDGDMHTLVKGFNCSPWLIIIVLGVPFIIILVHFFFSFLPRALYWLFPQSPSRRAVMATLTAFAIFGFYGAAGWSEADAVSHNISVFSVCVLLPVVIISELWLLNRLRLINQNTSIQTGEIEQPAFWRKAKN